MNHQLSSIPSAANIKGSVWTHGSPRRQSNLEVERLWFGVTSNTEVPGRSVRWMVTLISAKYQQILASQYIPNYKSGQIFQQDGAPCHTSGSTMKFFRGKKIKVLQGWPAQSPDINIIEHIWGRNEGGSLEDQAEELGGALVFLQGGLPCHPQRLHQQALHDSDGKPDGNCSADQRNP